MLKNILKTTLGVYSIVVTCFLCLYILETKGLQREVEELKQSVCSCNNATYDDYEREDMIKELLGVLEAQNIEVTDVVSGEYDYSIYE